jgi:hypothetical protein
MARGRKTGKVVRPPSNARLLSDDSRYFFILVLDRDAT